MRAPSGTVTFLFTDIEGSTERWERNRSAMQEAVRRHDAIIRVAVAARGGYVFKTIGDAFCVTFASAGSAVACAIDAQRELAAEDFSAVDGVRVRMAIHSGTADERDGDYFGPSANRVARLLAAGHGGQVLLSGAAAALAAPELPGDAHLEDLGEHRLKDIAAPEHVFRLAAEGLERDVRPLNSLNAHTAHLPQQLSKLFGRDGAIAAIEGLVRESRLVTITGAGGIGKTRTALAVGAAVADGWPGGVWFINLSAAEDTAFVANEVAATVGVPQSAERDLLDQIVRHLQARSVLLILDNCEHVLDEASRVVGTLLQRCPGVSILATSREPLEIAGERTFRLPSLSVPPADRLPNAKEALGFESIALFVDRATAVNPDFVLTDEHAPIVADICRRLDGIAFAIELAAARMHVLGPAALRSQLDHRFRVLTGGGRTALPRRKTMRALIDWSYDLLDDAEKLVFVRSAVFAGGWSLEGAEATLSGDGIEPDEVLELLSSLVRKSMVTADVAVDTTRFRLLESTREYARERLRDGGAADAVSERHLRWVASVVAELARESRPQEREAALRRARAELDSIRSALAWALQPGRSPGLGALIVADLGGGPWYDAGYQSEGRRWAEEALAHIDQPADPHLAGRLHRVLAFLSVGQSAVAAGERAGELLKAGGDTRVLALNSTQLAVNLFQVGRLDDAAAEIAGSLDALRELGITRSFEYAEALDAQGNILLAGGRADDAYRSFEESSGLYRDLGDAHGTARTQGNLAELEFAQGNPRRALELVSAAAATFRDLGSASRESNALVNASAYHLALGDTAAAESSARAGLQLARATQDPVLVSVAIQILAAVHASRGEAVRAARLLGFVDAWYLREGYQREANEQQVYTLVMAQLRKQLPAEEVAALLTAGASLGEDAAVAEA